MRDPTRPRWRCGEPGCWASDWWQPVRDAIDRSDLDAAMDALDAHYATVHPDLVEEVIGHVQLAAA